MSSSRSGRPCGPHPLQSPDYAVLATLSRSYPTLQGRLPMRYSPVRHWCYHPFDLHVLGTPPAFVLSQDQTLMFNFVKLGSLILLLAF
jgi:hypothetical protein